MLQNKIKIKFKKRDTRRLLEVMDMFVILIMMMVPGYIHIPKLISLYNLDMYKLLHVNYTSIKQLFGKLHGFPLTF